MEGNGRIGRIIFKNISMPREMGIGRVEICGN
jgi:hypothetical protein